MTGPYKSAEEWQRTPQPDPEKIREFEAQFSAKPAQAKPSQLPDGIVMSLDNETGDGAGMADDDASIYDGGDFLEGIAANIVAGLDGIATKQLKQTDWGELIIVAEYLVDRFDWSTAKARAKVEQLSGRKMGAPDDPTVEPKEPGILGVWDAGLDVKQVSPRGWLLGNVFCRRFVSSIIADGGVGKSALRTAQGLSLASGKALTGEHIFQRAKVLIASFEDDEDEHRRRMKAAMLHHGIKPEDVAGHLFLACPSAKGGKLMTADDKGRPVPGLLAENLRLEIVAKGIDLVILDPFIKTHSVEENDNSAIDDVMQILTDLAAELNIAVDLPHHTSKGPADPGNANRGRGASGMKDAARLVYTLCPMTPEEAQLFGVQEPERRRLIRMDSGKVNVAPPLDSAKWFRLVGVPLGNGNELYPHGDEVQTVEVWTPPDTWAGLSHHLLNEILTEIDKGLPDGNRYSDGPNVADRAAWKVVMAHASDRTEKQARDIIKAWVKNGVLTVGEYENPVTRKTVKGVRVNAAKRPS